MKLAELISSLTVEQAKEYAAQTDKWCWVVDNLLDPYDIPNSKAEKVEDALEALLK
jgi:hypothetical protein